MAGFGLYYDDRSTAAAACFGLMLVFMHRWDGQAGRLACLEPLRACGRRSFSIYLIHLPVVMILNAALFDLGLSSFPARLLVIVPVATLASLAAGWGFFHAVEKRFTGAPTLPKLVLSDRSRRSVPAHAE